MPIESSIPSTKAQSLESALAVDKVPLPSRRPKPCIDMNPQNPHSHGSQMKPWSLAEASYADIKNRDIEVAIIPFGATEPHNLHLPYATDTIEADTIGDRICESAYGKGAKVILLPTIPYGTETNMRRLPLAVNLYPSTIATIIHDLVESCVRSGIQKIMLLNSHGGNEFKPILRELAGQTEAQLFLCNWFRMVGDRYGEIFAHPEDHAGEMETSILLACRPDLVRRNDDHSLAADDGSTRATRFDAVNKGWVSITRSWDHLTTNTGSGNPHEATAEKGEAVLDLIVERLSGFLVELSETPIDASFPFDMSGRSDADA